MNKDWKCTPSIDASSQVDSQGGIRRVDEKRGLFDHLYINSALLEST